MRMQCGVTGRHEQETARAPLGVTIDLDLEQFGDAQVKHGAIRD